MIAAAWSWLGLAGTCAAAVGAAVVLYLIREHGPLDPIAHDPEGEE